MLRKLIIGITIAAAAALGVQAIAVASTTNPLATGPRFSAAAINCDGWTFSFKGFPVDANVTIYEAATYPNGVVENRLDSTLLQAAGSKSQSRTSLQDGEFNLTAWAVFNNTIYPLVDSSYFLTCV